MSIDYTVKLGGMPMRKILLLISIVFAVVLTCSLVYASDTDVYCDGEKIDFSEGPYIIDGATFVPVRALGDALGFNYTWDAQNSTVIVTSDVAIAWIQADNNAISVTKDGMMYAIVTEAFPRIINDRIFIPLRAVSELFDASVEWDSETSSVHIMTDSYVETEVIVDNTSVNITDNSQDDSTTDDNLFFYGYDGISVNGFTSPTKVNKGSSYVLSGEITSQYNLDRVNIKVIDVESDTTEINETTFDIDSQIYPLSDIDSRITFGKLSVGDKILRITCVDVYEERATFEYTFIIRQPEGAKLEGDVEMLWPVPSSGLVTTIFWCDNPACHSNAGRVNGHAALDIAAPLGSDVIAVMDGVVKLQGFGNYDNQKTGYGNFILLDHGDGLETQYAHLSEIYVTDEQEVKAGDVIGAVGSTGNSTGPHLDFYITKDGVRCDPLYCLEFHENIRVTGDCDLPFFEQAVNARK